VYIMDCSGLAETAVRIDAGGDWNPGKIGDLGKGCSCWSTETGGEVCLMLFAEEDRLLQHSGSLCINLAQNLALRVFSYLLSGQVLG
jgi:hypothetical protein